MQTIVAVVSIVVEKEESVESLNALLHEFGEYIIGRMGIPYRAKGVNLVSVALDAPLETIACRKARNRSGAQRDYRIFERSQRGINESYARHRTQKGHGLRIMIFFIYIRLFKYSLLLKNPDESNIILKDSTAEVT